MNTFILKTCAVALTFISSLAFESLEAAEYPSRPIRIIAPSTPGGVHDLVARLLSPKLMESLGQPIIVENKPGGGFVLATNLIAKAAPDGLTIGTIATPHVTNPVLVPKLPYDTEKDFSPVATLCLLPMMLVVKGDSPYKTLDDLISAARKNPGSLKFGSATPGGAPHLAGEMLKRAAGFEALNVPYKGVPEARLAILSGEVDFLFDSLEAMELVRTGRFRSLGLATPKRVPTVKDMPTLAESLPGFTVEAFIAVMAPAHTPPEIIQKLNTTINQALASPDVDARMNQMMFPPLIMTVDQTKKFLDEQAVKWGNLAKSLKLQ